ncbi:hypothetical protein DYGSA30_32680 [Dyella sp. GSA-30]|nr:hypothetical protein DYGSA30_32680 [Dyella sp. GSA-30]
MSKRIHECIGCRVVCLPHIADRGGNGGEDDKAIQRDICTRPVQVQRAGYLRTEYLMQLLPGLLDQEAVTQDSGAVDDPVKAFVLFRKAVHQLSDSRLVGDVDCVITHDGAQGFQLAYLDLDTFVHDRSPGQDQRNSLRLSRDVAREDQPQTACAARNQVDPMCLPRCNRLRRLRQLRPTADLTHPIGITYMHRKTVAILRQRLRHILTRFDLDKLTDQTRVLHLRRTQHAAEAG